MNALVILVCILLSSGFAFSNDLPEGKEFDNGRVDTGADSRDDHYNGRADSGEGSRSHGDYGSTDGEGKAGVLGVFNKLPEKEDFNNGRVDTGADSRDDHYNGRSDSGEGSRRHGDYGSTDGEGKAGVLGVFNKLPEKEDFNNGRVDTGADSRDDHYNGRSDSGEGSRSHGDYGSTDGEGKAGVLGVFNKLPEKEDFNNGRVDTGADSRDDHYNGRADSGEGSRSHGDYDSVDSDGKAGVLGVFQLGKPDTVQNWNEYLTIKTAWLELAEKAKEPKFKEALFSVTLASAGYVLLKQLAKSPTSKAGAIGVALSAVFGSAELAAAEEIDLYLTSPELLLSLPKEEKEIVVYDLIKYRFEEMNSLIQESQNL